MKLGLAEKKVLVTGSTAGIGFAIAESLLEEGASVVVNGRSEPRVTYAVKSLRSKADEEGLVEGFVGDLATATGVYELKKAHPSFDIIINNLGVYEAKDVSAITQTDWERMFQTNVVSGALIAQQYLPGMKERDWGRLIFIASEAGVNIPADMVHYGVSKAAQMALARGLAETTAGTGVTVNSVLPGPTYSEGVDKFLADVVKDVKGDRSDIERDFLTKLRPTSLLKRFATAREVANLVTYLASPLASATNGAAMRVEGGLLRNFI